MIKARILPLILILLAVLATGTALAASGGLGRTEFPNSGAPEAQESFLRGLLLLHSFEYHDARDAFRQARKIDPDFAMAFWGEAMTHNHPIWVERDMEAGRKALADLAATPEERRAKAPTEREKAYLDALEELYVEDRDKESGDLAFAGAMARVAERFPKDLDAAAFHAVALLGTCQHERDVAVYMRAAAVVEEVFAKNPLHPGAAHYLIHAYDDAVHAPLGLRAARVYAKIAPAAPHALHMPSHVFLALGLWDEVAASNEDSFDAAEERVVRESLPVERRNYHALWWMTYAYLQQGRFGAAAERLASISGDAAKSGSGRVQGHLAHIRAAFLLERGELPEGVPMPDLDAIGLRPAIDHHLAEGIAAHRAGRPGDVKKQLGILMERIGNEDADDPSEAAGQIAAAQLAALVELGAGEAEKAISILTATAAAEEALAFGFGPPSPIKPAGELLGEVLLGLGRPAEAREAFEAALARAPRRSAGLRGLDRAAAATRPPPPRE